MLKGPNLNPPKFSGVQTVEEQHASVYTIDIGKKKVQLDASFSQAIRVITVFYTYDNKLRTREE